MNLFPKPPSFSQLTEGLDTWPNWIKNEFQQRAINVKWFGAKGDGIADDTAAINAMIAAGNDNSNYRNIYFPAGTYLISSPLTSLLGHGWHISGSSDQDTTIKATHNGDLMSIDVSTYAAYYLTLENLIFDRVPGTAYNLTCGFRVKADLLSATGLQYAKFKNLRFQNLYNGIYVEDTAKYTFGSFTGIAYHGFITFEDIIAPYCTDAVYECIVYEGGTGGHTTFINGKIRGSAAAIRLGSSGWDGGLGDVIFVGVHVTTADVGIDIYGRTVTATHYNQNINITGCQIDNCTTATVRMDNMQNFRIFANNSTAAVGIVLTNCTNYIVEDRNDISFGGSLTLNDALITTNGYITDTNGTRYTTSAMARRHVDTSNLKLSGGSLITNGASLDLYGGTHATTPNLALLDGDNVKIRKKDGSVTRIQADSTGVQIGDGVWNGVPLKLGAYFLWVDATGDLRIKSGAPANDLDGVVIGSQS